MATVVPRNKSFASIAIASTLDERDNGMTPIAWALAATFNASARSHQTARFARLAGALLVLGVVSIDSIALQLHGFHKSMGASYVLSEEVSPCSEAWLSQLRRKIERGEIEPSIRTLKADATRCSENAKYHALLSLALRSKGEAPSAAKEMNLAIKLDPSHPDFFFQLAQILFDNSDLGGARIVLVRANKKFPDEVWTYLFLATVLQNLGSANGAEEVLERATRRWPRKPEVYILLGNILSARDLHQRALAEYKRALSINSGLPQGYLFYGIELDRLERTERAIAAFEECLRLAPKMPNCHYYLGKLLLKKGEPSRAVQQLEIAINIDPQYALAYFELGKAYRTLGDADRADKSMQKYSLLSESQRAKDSQRRQDFRDGLTGR